MIAADTPQLLLLHGWGFGADVWRSLIEQLDARWRVNAISLPGYEKDNDQSQNVMPVPALLDRLTESLEQSVILIGWSLGGLLAIELARRYPDRIKALGLIAALPCFNRQPDWAAGWDNPAVTAVHDRLQQDAAAATRYVAALAARGDEHSRHIRQTLTDLAVSRQGVLERDLDYLRHTDLRQAFAGLDIPVHVWLGDRDAFIGGDCAGAIRTLQSDAHIHELEHTGHAPLLSRPRDIAEHLESLL